MNKFEVFSLKSIIEKKYTPLLTMSWKRAYRKHQRNIGTLFNRFVDILQLQTYCSFMNLSLQG